MYAEKWTDIQDKRKHGTVQKAQRSASIIETFWDHKQALHPPMIYF